MIFESLCKRGRHPIVYLSLDELQNVFLFRFLNYQSPIEDHSTEDLHNTERGPLSIEC